MGTAHEWVRVLAAGGFWGGWMALFGWLSIGQQFEKPSRLFTTMYCLGCAFGALSFGVEDTFGGLSFRPPLLFLHIACFVGMLVIGLYTRRLARNHARLANYPTDSPLFGRTGRPKPNS